MAYDFNGCIGAENVCKKIVKKFSELKMVHLYEDLFIVPMPDEFLNSLSANDTEIIPNFGYLTSRMANTFFELSSDCTFAYLEAEYFGGTGGKRAVVYENMKIAFQDFTEDAFNIVLRHFGINKKNSFDEFEEVGFGEYRSTEDW